VSALLVDFASHGKLWLTGPDRQRFLHGMVTNDVTSLKAGQGCHAAMLTVKGKLLGDLRIYCDEDGALVESDAEAAGKIKDALEKHLIMDDVVIEDRTSTGEVGIFGDGARTAVERSFGALPELAPHHHLVRDGVRICASRALGRDGFRLFGENLAARLGMPFLDERDAEILRVEAGEPRYGADMGEDHLPIESRLDDSVSFSKGCYLGQEVMVRVTQQGRINRKLMGLFLDGDAPVASGAKLSAPGREEAGTVTSSVISPRLGPIALGYVHRTLWAPGTQLSISGGRAATVSELPFPASR
jgi:folate-binding protein YgfZ